MNEPIQYEFDFDDDVNAPPVLMKVLRDPCEYCARKEAEITITKRGNDIGICNSCADDDYMAWVEQMND